MNSVLQLDLASKPVDESTSELDVRAKDLSTSLDHNYAVGPFEVLDFTGIRPLASLSSGHDLDQDIVDNNIPKDEANNISSRTTQSIESFNNMNVFVDWADLFEFDFSYPDFALNNHSHAEPRTTLKSDVSHNFDQAAFGQTAFLYQQPAVSHKSPDVIILPNPSSPVASLGFVPLQDAQILLKHFNDRVIAHFSSLPPGEKPHWLLLNVRSATLTLADITFMQVSLTTNAAMANLMALLSISALHLAHQIASKHPQNALYWQNVSNLSIQKAREHLQYSLKKEVRGMNHAKYKDQVMALSAMLTFAVLYDKQQEARAYMIDTERLVRIRGLAKRTISRKVRILHHMYSWSRIIGESTYVLRNYGQSEIVTAIGSYNNSSQKRRVEPESPFGHNPKLDDFLQLDQDAAGSDVDINGQKDREKGLNDIHLEDPREYPATMYLQLYGISETWLSLVSQTTRLANINDCLDGSKKRKDVELLHSIERRKQRLEHMVCSFAATNKPMYSSVPQQRMDQSLESENETPRSCIVRALNSSLVIFFYRRIRNVHPWILQDHVKSVIQALQDFEVNCQAFKIEAVDFSWLVFMAGCEAISQIHRNYLSQWLDNAFAKTGFERFKTIQSCMQEVWERRDNFNNQNDKGLREKVWSWIHVSREKKIYMLLS